MGALALTPLWPPRSESFMLEPSWRCEVSNKESRAAVVMGRKKADEILASRRIARNRRARALSKHTHTFELNVHLTSATGLVAIASLQTVGFLVAVGDSWFDYPMHDVLKLLDDNYGYNVESAAHRRDSIEAMANQGGQIEKLARCLEKVSA